jgi:23S rRNA pseudouridine955/2504/2580 synthase
MNALGLNRLFLHAKLISFQHPVSAERMTFEAPLDKALAQILTKLVKK